MKESQPKCFQCKKAYQKPKNAVGCLKCAPNVKISEIEFRKKIYSKTVLQ